MKLQGDWGGFVASSRALLRLRAQQCARQNRHATQAKNRFELFARPRVTVNLELSKLFFFDKKPSRGESNCYLFGASAHFN